MTCILAQCFILQLAQHLHAITLPVEVAGSSYQGEFMANAFELVIIVNEVVVVYSIGKGLKLEGDAGGGFGWGKE